MGRKDSWVTFCKSVADFICNMDFKRKIKRSFLTVNDALGSRSFTDSSETGSLLMRVQHAQSVLAALENLRRREELCDVILKVAEREIKAHRVVLAAVSPYFNAMFTSDLVESKQEVINLTDLDPLAVQMVVEFAYVARVNITVDNVQSLLNVASLLQVETLVEKCCYFLEHELHPSNCLGIRRFAHNHGCLSLSKIAYDYAMRNFSQVTQLEEFFQCPLEEILELISEDALYVRHEEEVYEAAVRWVKYNLKDRMNTVPMLAEQIRFPLMAWEFLVTKVLDDGFITRNAGSSHLFEEARMYHMSPQMRANINQGNRLRPRKLYGQAEWIYVLGGETNPGKKFPWRWGRGAPYKKRMGHSFEILQRTPESHHNPAVRGTNSKSTHYTWFLFKVICICNFFCHILTCYLSTHKAIGGRND